MPVFLFLTFSTATNVNVQGFDACLSERFDNEIATNTAQLKKKLLTAFTTMEMNSLP